MADATRQINENGTVIYNKDNLRTASRIHYGPSATADRGCAASAL